MKRTTAAIIIAVLLVYGLGSIFYYALVIDEIRFRPMVGEVLSKGNMVIENYDNITEIRLGKMWPGYGNIIDFKELNNESHIIKVDLKVYGPVKNLVQIEPESFILKPGEEKTYKVTFQPSLTERAGVYTGDLKIIKKRLLW